MSLVRHKGRLRKVPTRRGGETTILPDAMHHYVDARDLSIGLRRVLTELSQIRRGMTTAELLAIDRLCSKVRKTIEAADHRREIFYAALERDGRATKLLRRFAADLGVKLPRGRRLGLRSGGE